jgi:hypothetical protein
LLILEQLVMSQKRGNNNEASMRLISLPQRGGSPKEETVPSDGEWELATLVVEQEMAEDLLGTPGIIQRFLWPRFTRLALLFGARPYPADC